MDPASIGRVRYRKKDYHNALECFTEAVAISSGHLLLDALDHRAATYEKLDQLQNALRDSKRMIEISPDAAKGYLRCGKILQLRGDVALALKIYERGLKRTKIGQDDHRHTLQKLAAGLQKKLGPRKASDPFEKIPLELAYMIYQQLGIQDLVICLAVSKVWKRLLEAMHDLWTVLDLRVVRNPISVTSLKAYCRRSDFQLRAAMLRFGSHGISTSKLKYLLQTCRNLEHLELRQGYVGDTLLQSLPLATPRLQRLILGRDAIVTLNCVTKIFDTCPSLTVAEFHCVANKDPTFRATWPRMECLTGLVLSSSHQRHVDDCSMYSRMRSRPLDYDDPNVISLNLDQLLRETPNMQSASITDWAVDRSVEATPETSFQAWSHLEHLSLRGGERPNLHKLPKSLQTLDLSCVGGNPFVISDASDHDMGLPLLREFNCSSSLDIDMGLVAQLIKPSAMLGHLELLYLGHLENSESDSLTLRHTVLSPSVRELCLSNVTLSEECLIQILENFPAVRRLDISGTRVTGCAIKYLLTRTNSQLQWLDIGDCRKLSTDAIEYARASGIVVECSPDKKGW